jgi:hypothetical protein
MEIMPKLERKRMLAIFTPKTGKKPKVEPKPLVYINVYRNPGLPPGFFICQSPENSWLFD